MRTAPIARRHQQESGASNVYGPDLTTRSAPVA